MKERTIKFPKELLDEKEKYDRLVYKFAKLVPALDVDDLYQIAFIKALDNPERAYVSARNGIVDEIRKYRGRVGSLNREAKIAGLNYVPINDLPLWENLGEYDYHTKPDFLFLDYDHLIAEIDKLGKRESYLIKALYFEDKNGLEIAKHLGLTNARVSQIKISTLKLLKKRILTNLEKSLLEN